MAVPYTFGTATAAIPLSNLDSNFATTITLGNTAIQLGNTVTTLNNMTLANVTVSSGNVTLTNVAITTANVTTANIGTAVITGTSTLTGLTASTALALDASKNIASVTNTGTGNNVLATSPTITTPTISQLTSAAATALTLQSAGTTAVTVDTSQNVGVGTTSPNKKLEVVSAGEIIRATSSAGANDQNISIKNNSGTADTSTNIFFADRYAATSYASSYIRGTASGTSALIFATGGTNFTNIYDAGAPTERMRIDSSGNVGIGTTSQLLSAMISVVPGASRNGLAFTMATGYESILTNNPSAAAYTFGDFRQNNTIVGTIAVGTTATSYNTSGTSGVIGVDASTIGFNTASTERMRIDSDGRVLINKTSNNGTSLVQMTSPASTDIILAQIGTNGGSAMAFLNSGGAAQVGNIVVNVATTAYNTSSDYRLKEDIAPMTGALAKVALLKPVTYKWKSDGSDAEGFIAHELAEVAPQCVTGEKDAVDADGNPKYQGIDVSFLVATLTAAIQEQQALITSLTARITALEST